MQDWTTPSRYGDDVWNRYTDFSTDVEHIVEQIRILHARRRKQYSVAFDVATKVKIRHHLDQIKEVVDKLHVSEKKRESLYNGINQLLAEVDRNRTRFDAFAALTIEMADVGEKVASPVTKILDSIAGLFGKAKDAENATRQLPAPKPMKQIEGPKKVPAPASGGWEPPADLDDEIPF